ncbi:unnamed protein product [Triticum turgidum subsp. durum]|uniref:non-specific serine/threonine protein kinase n=1 Tax=Triticum turgidum subsp. durum TaxID=4567 RepID=A0A9R0SNK6_TRITD|nr:unnamed protein product [Triticum turgidum subsp. durum]
MERGPWPRAMAARWLLLLLLGPALQVHAQLDSSDFISIDCGLPETSTGFTDNVTKLSYVPDTGFTDAGTNHNISAEYVTASLPMNWHTLRSFSGDRDARSCYTVGDLVSGLKYLIRAMFMYGNYDNLNRLPIFDLYLGVNYWQTVNISATDEMMIYEIISIISDDHVQVCLVDTGSGTPFISSLDLRPLKNNLYPQSDESQGLVLSDRRNFGASDSVIVRYPDDPYHRIWMPLLSKTAEWSVISTDNIVENRSNSFEAPSAVMQTAVMPTDPSSAFGFIWNAQSSAKNHMPGYVCMVYLAELQHLPRNTVRQFNIYLNGELGYSGGYTPSYLFTDVIYSDKPFYSSHPYNISMNATKTSTLPPIMNAAEIFSVVSTTGTATIAQEVAAITAVRDTYKVKKNWMGDPCAPKKYAWDGLRCKYFESSPPSVTGLNLSSSGLSGNVSFSFANLKGLQYLDLSSNNLTGSIPEILSQLSLLTLLDFTGNQLSGSIPSELLKRTRDDSLIIKYDNNPNLCTNRDSCQPAQKNSRSMVAVYVVGTVVAVLLIVLLLVLLLFLRRRMHGTTSNIITMGNKAIIAPSHAQSSSGHSSLRLDNRRFTYNELETITNSFQRVIGRGGFGKVYHGFLQDGTQVAVKLRSESSDQGVQEFLAEAQTLAKIHHKNLVSLIGYCKEREYMALVYEYMPEGALHQHLGGSTNNGKTLTWRQRLRIALESAQGLEYLHKGCNPPLIHRDVKTSNILLNANLEAKIADFGLLKAFNRGNDTHVSTARVVGTYGYLAPEYLATFQLTNKSDVFSFGVVLLEIVTGQPHILNGPEPTSIVQWVRQRLAHGNIEAVVDSRMRGDHDINSVWKVADTALKCTTQAPEQRPTMTDLVAQLQECLELEVARGYTNAGFYTTRNGDDMSTNVSQRTFEIDHLGRVPTMSTGPALR